MSRRLYLPRSKPRRPRKPPLRISQILRWADAHHGRTGRWPISKSGPILDAPDETWIAVQTALVAGCRGLPGGSTLARLLAEQRGVPNRLAVPRLSIEKILAWADAHHARTGQWPKKDSGSVRSAPGESWSRVNNALNLGCRGLHGRTSLAALLFKRRGVRHHLIRPTLREHQILQWADAYRARTGNWPHAHAGRVAPDVDGNWAGIDTALSAGQRGLPGGSSLAKLLAARRGHRNTAQLPPLSIDQVLKWADRHWERNRSWPRRNSGQIARASGETWLMVDAALHRGRRGLPTSAKTNSLARLLAEHRGVRNSRNLTELSIGKIIRWADRHHRRTGYWPSSKSGPIPDAPGETWSGVATALRTGRRGLPQPRPNQTLADLLAVHRGVANRSARPPLRIAKVLGWADRYHERTGAWPKRDSGPIEDAPGENWGAVIEALYLGRRGLPLPPRARSLADLLAEHRGVRHLQKLPELNERRILSWADEHYRRTGSWPTMKSGPVRAAVGETWGAIDVAMRAGVRGLKKGSSLPRLLAEFRGVRNRKNLPPFTTTSIVRWISAHRRRTGNWPKLHDGAIAEAPGETWTAVDSALRSGIRGLRGGSSLFRLIASITTGYRPG